VYQLNEVSQVQRSVQQWRVSGLPE